MNEHDSSGTALKGVCMKFIFLALAMLVAASSLAFGQTSSNNTNRTGNDDKARRLVLATDDRRIEALRGGNVESLRQIYADDYTLVTPTGIIRSKADQINELASGEFRYEKFELKERIVRVYGDVVIVLSRENIDILRAGQHTGGDMRFTRTYKKFGKNWRVIATHGSFVTQ